jgi:hypothetical protein
MPQVIYVADRFLRPQDENSIVVRVSPSGQVDADILEAAIERANREGIPTVYVVNE